ncbi:MAG: TonB-dependent receptor [Deltaproteobacteria bacterium]|nr:TonB-dependent receptor [Deltaproteobacteria bacterium]
MTRAVLIAVLAAAAPTAAQGPEPVPTEAPDAEPAEPSEDGQPAEKGEVIEIRSSRKPGSDHSVGEKELERFEHDDIHQILAEVPGVYFREEDGFGLRPNIGMRGSNPERSAKVALMEDGILVAPAPYAAPAAYYFPLVTRMQSVEVVKGPGAVIYGPNTVGGSINMISQEVPRGSGQSGYIDVAGGATLYGKVHGRYGFASKYGGVLIEGVRLHSNGFKDLDGGGDTGFDKTDLLFKARLNSDPMGSTYQAVNLTVGYADELSRETYTGLADDDFDRNPDRRYRGTAQARMEWDHLRWQLSHRLEYEAKLDLTTTFYRNSFQRAWRKLNAFRGESDIGAVLANPNAGNNPIYYGVLTGELDTSSAAEELLIGTNDRQFVSQGLQSVIHSEQRAWPGRHDLSAGVRLHVDQVDRLHTEDAFAMVAGELMRTAAETQTTTDSLARSSALALFAQDKLEVGPMVVTIGSRVEIVRNEFEDMLAGSEQVGNTYAVWIPGLGAYYQASEWLGLLAGVHRGFVPVAPGSDGSIDPETSVNYEAGARLTRWDVQAEAIGFFNDYSNLKGTCTVSSGCQTGQVGDEFNGGQVRTYGFESIVRTEKRLGYDLRVPVRLSYTFTRARFQSDFTSTFPQWGDVESGDFLPYIAAHQLSARAGVGQSWWELNASLRYQSRMRDTAGQSDDDVSVPSYAVLDVAGSVDFGAWGKAYITLDNLTDNRYLVSLRPFGARPGKPRIVIAGYKQSF